MNVHIQSVLAFCILLCTAHAATRYVALNGGHVSPFDSWSKAATNIQTAVDIAVAGEEVVVSNGVYSGGSRTTPGHYSLNRVLITNAIILQSLSGTAATIIMGEGPIGASAVRCIYALAGLITGFTLTNGHTADYTGNDYEKSGGGINMYGGNAVVSNCIISGNKANWGGGGCAHGTANKCLIIGNNAAEYGGGAYRSMVNDSDIIQNISGNYGGGSGDYNDECVINRCVIKGNTAVSGGGCNNDMINNCLIIGNSAQYGGATYYSAVNNCTISGNSASSSGGGTYAGTVRNSIAWGNTAWNYGGGPLYQYSCTTPLLSGVGNTNANPQFVNAASGDYHLAETSPCRDAGTNAYAFGATDLGGNPRVIDGRVDMGAYEFVPEPGSALLLVLMTMYNLQFAIRRAGK